EHGAGSVGIEPHLRSQADERAMVADRGTLTEVGVQQAFLQSVLITRFRSETQQAMRIEGVAGLDTFESKLDALFSAHAPHAVEHLLGLLQWHSVLLGQ